MSIWSSEIKELEKLYASFKGALPDLEKELEQLIKTDDPVVVLVYSRRSLELIVNELCETELKRPRKTEPLKGIIDKLNSENKVPEHIITTMLNLNSMSTYGAHPKDFDPRQVRTTLINLTTIIEWYYKYCELVSKVISNENSGIAGIDSIQKNENDNQIFIKDTPRVFKFKIKTLLIFTILLIGIVLLFVLDIFNIFRKKNIENLRDDKGKISIAVMPFQNMTNDTLLDIWQLGVQNELISKLSNIRGLSVRQYQAIYDITRSKDKLNYAAITPSLAGELSRKLDASTFILGSIKNSGVAIRINTQLINAETEEVYKTFQIEGHSEDDIFKIIDSLSRLVADFLEIKVLERDHTLDIPEFTSTNSVQAFRFYIQGLNSFFELDYSNSIKMMNQAVDIDSNFFSARVFLICSYYNIGDTLMNRLSIKKAYQKIDNGSYIDRLMLDYFKNIYEKDMLTSIKITEQLIEYEPHFTFWYNQGLNYSMINQYESAIKCYEKVFEIRKKWGVNWNWLPLYTMSGSTYHKLGNHVRENEIYEMGLTIVNNKAEIISLQAICALSKGDMLTAQESLSKYRIIRDEEGWEEHLILNALGYIYMYAGNITEAEKYFKQAIVKDPKYILGQVNLVHLYFKNNINLKKGMEIIEQASNILPKNPYLMYIKGMGLYKKGEFDKALEILSKSWVLQPEYNHEHYLLIKEVKQALADKNNKKIVD